MKRLVGYFVVALFTIILSGCTAKTPVGISASYSAYSNYDDKIPGVYGLYVNAEQMKGQANPSGFFCSATDYPIDARDTFTQSVHRTFENLLEEIKIFDKPISAKDLQVQGLDGMIKVEVEDLEADMILVTGFWTELFIGEAEITAIIQVIGHNGNLMESTVEASEDYRINGFFCAGASDAIGKSIEVTIKETMERLGTRLANSVKVREAAPKN